MTSRAEERAKTWSITKTTLKKDEGMYGVIPKSREDFEKNFAQLEYLRSIFYPTDAPMDRSVLRIRKLSDGRGPSERGE